MRSGDRKPSPCEGDAVFFQDWIERHYSRVYRVLSRLLDSSDDAEDVAQEVMLAAWSHLSRFRGEAAMTTWLHRMAVNRAFSFKRSAHHRMTVGSEPSALSWVACDNEASDPAVRCARSDASRRLRDAVAALPEKQRLVTTLHYYGEATTPEIASALGIAESTVRSHLRHAHRRLRILLSEDWRD